MKGVASALDKRRCNGMLRWSAACKLAKMQEALWPHYRHTRQHRHACSHPWWLLQTRYIPHCLGKSMHKWVGGHKTCAVLVNSMGGTCRAVFEVLNCVCIPATLRSLFCLTNRLQRWHSADAGSSSWSLSACINVTHCYPSGAE